MARMGTTNPNTLALIRALRRASVQHNAGIWKRVAEIVSRPARKRVVVNVGEIERHTHDGDLVVVPGKVLGSGNLNHRVTVAALSASASARQIIITAGGSLMTIEEMLKLAPTGAGVTILV
ncbi:MAG: 50S ribosomal protein L18e [Candidatus Thorarchaeota archaeon]